MKPLSDLLQGEFGYIVDLKDKNVLSQLFEMGCFPGDLIRVVDNHPTQEFMTFRYRKNLIHLDRSKARTIMTNPVSYHFCLN
jgi:Fe2+ transport system protein FeoA